MFSPKTTHLPYQIAALFFGIYLLSMPEFPGGRINMGDSIKFQYLWAVNGLPHSTGYPLYLLLAKLFGSTLTLFEPYTRINLLSVVSASAALLMFTKLLIAFKFSYVRIVLASVLLGSSYTYWTQASEAEVYALNALFHFSICFLFIRFYQSRSEHYLYIGIAVYALSLGNHLTMVTLLPALIYLIWRVNPYLLIRPKLLLWALFCAVLGASQYLYCLYLSHGESQYLEYLGPNASISRLWAYITGAQFAEQLGGRSISGGINTFLKAEYRKEFNPVFMLLWLLSLPWLFFGKRIDAELRVPHQFLLLAFVPLLLFSSQHNISDIATYYLPLTGIICVQFISAVPPISVSKARHIGMLSVALLTIIINGARNGAALIPPNDDPSPFATLRQQLPNGAVFFSPGSWSIGHYPGTQAVNYHNAHSTHHKTVRVEPYGQRLAGQTEIYSYANELADIHQYVDVKAVSTVAGEFIAIDNMLHPSSPNAMLLLINRGKLSPSLHTTLSNHLEHLGLTSQFGTDNAAFMLIHNGRIVAEGSHPHKLSKTLAVHGREWRLSSRLSPLGPYASSAWIKTPERTVLAPGLNVLELDESGAIIRRAAYSDASTYGQSYPLVVVKVRR
ncbi:Uncharacterised protein [BD1-7 clade bacterium]|nr:Uncharacterised protein [BD1-7 clade bacterium]